MRQQTTTIGPAWVGRAIGRLCTGRRPLVRDAKPGAVSGPWNAPADPTPRPRSAALFAAGGKQPVAPADNRPLVDRGPGMYVIRDVDPPGAVLGHVEVGVDLRWRTWDARGAFSPWSDEPCSLPNARWVGDPFQVPIAPDGRYDRGTFT